MWSHVSKSILYQCQPRWCDPPPSPRWPAFPLAKPSLISAARPGRRRYGIRVTKRIFRMEQSGFRSSSVPVFSGLPQKNLWSMWLEKWMTCDRSDGWGGGGPSFKQSEEEWLLDLWFIYLQESSAILLTLIKHCCTVEEKHWSPDQAVNAHTNRWWARGRRGPFLFLLNHRCHSCSHDVECRGTSECQLSAATHRNASWLLK